MTIVTAREKRGARIGTPRFDKEQLRTDNDGYLPISPAIASPISAGDTTTWIPAAFMAAILLAAVPSPPEMIAPAWPMRRPGGAVCPAMKPTTGFFTWALM